MHKYPKNAQMKTHAAASQLLILPFRPVIIISLFTGLSCQAIKSSTPVGSYGSYRVRKHWENVSSLRPLSE